jgi:lipopolysaccharide transport system permease protein
MQKQALTFENLPVTRITPPERLPALQLSELWEYRELLFFFVWRDIKVRYKQTVLGAAWAVIQPLLTMVVFSIFLGRFVQVPSQGVPYPIFAYAALVPWTYFANAVTQSSSSLIANENTITKVYFPRLLVPLASVLSGLPDFLIAFLVLIAMMVYYGIYPTAAIFGLPVFLFLAILSAAAAGIWLSALNVQYRDVRYTVPFLIQFWLFATPIAYPISVVPEKWRILYGLNPMVGVVEGFRRALFGQGQAIGWTILVSALTVLIILVTGFYYFRHMEETFADVV